MTAKSSGARPSYGDWRISPFFDALIIGVLVCASFFVSGMIVYSRTLAKRGLTVTAPQAVLPEPPASAMAPPGEGGNSEATARIKTVLQRFWVSWPELRSSGLNQALAIGLAVGALTGVFVFRSSRKFRRAFHELSEAERRLEDAGGAAGDYVWEGDVSGRYVYVSQRVSQVLGYEASELLGRTYFELASERDDVEERAAAILGEAQAFRNFEARMICKNGSIIWTSSHGTPLKDASGRLTGYRGATLDISDRKRGEEGLIRQKEAAQTATAAKSQFLAVMSHELRTPLNSVLGFADNLAMTPLSQEQRESLEMIRRNGDALLTLLNDILLFSRAEAGALGVFSEPTTIREFLEGVVALYRPSATAKRLELRLEVAPGVPPHLSLDQMRIRQILLNLIGNAVKFTLKGHVLVRAEATLSPNHSGEIELRIAVEDTGIGIPGHKTGFLFDAFWQGDSSDTRLHGGTGLGLPICRQLAGLLGGAVTLDASSREGSRFLFVCRCRQSESPVEKQQSGVITLPKETAPPRRRILIAEDNPANQKLLQLLLRNLGYASECAVNGQEAVEMHERTPFDIILMDLQMPVLDGLAATREIRRKELSSPAMRPVSVVALTANAMSGDRERCLAAGMNDYLAKPIRLDDLRHVIQKTLEASALEAGAN